MKQFLKILMISLMCCVQPLNAQQSSPVIVGKVYSKVEGPLIGVSVSEIDATNRVVAGTITDINGEFSLRVKSTRNKLSISYIGFKTKVVPIGDRKSFEVELLEDAETLDEVFVTAKRPTSTGAMTVPDREVSMAIQTIKADFGELSVASLDEALQGQIAGLDIVANSGDVGAGSSMRLRGVSSINANVDPLIVVDDQIFNSNETDNFDFANADSESFANLLAISVDDIESISVMKDASATAMWGSQGANGVIYIQTKRGRTGAPKVSYSYRFSQKWQPQGMRMLNGDEYTMFLKEAYFNPRHSDEASDIKEINYIQDDILFPDWRMYDNNTDWISAVKTTGITHDHHVSLSGGGQKATFYISAGYFSEKGSIIGQYLDRYTSRMDLRYNVSDRILFWSQMAFTYTDQKKNAGGLLDIAYKKMPNLAIYREDVNGINTGDYYIVPQSMSDELSDQRSLYNPIALAHLADNDVKSYYLKPVFGLEYDLIPRKGMEKLQLRTTVSFDINNNSSYWFLPKELTTAVWTDGSINQTKHGDSKSQSTNAKLELDWVTRLGTEDHVLRMVALGEMSGGSYLGQSQESYGLPRGVTSPTTGSYISGMSTSNSYWRSMYGIVNAHYSYKSKYNFGALLRQEGSSKFGKNNKFATFGSFSARWNIIDEKFMRPVLDWMSMLAVRTGVGFVGNAPKDEFLHFSRYESWSSYLGTATIRPVSIRLDDLRWEKTREVNVGADLGFFRDNFEVHFNYYDKVTSDLLMKTVAIPTSSGYSGYDWQNTGKIQNRGWDVTLLFNRIIHVGKFSMDASINFANNKNTILELDDIVLSQYNGDYDFNNGTYMSRLQLNNSLGSIYGFRYKGVYQYDIDNPDLVASGYTLGTAPIARDANGEVIFDSSGNPVPVYFGYGTSSQLQFQGGDAIYEDINNDGNINELDLVYLGNSNPKFNGGMSIKLRYDRLSLSINSTFRYGNKIVNIARMNAENMYTNNNQSRAVNWRWRKQGDVTDMPRALYNSGRNFLGSDRYIEDGSFWRINNISLNYNLPRKWLPRHVAIDAASVFVTGYNLFCFTKYSGVDPEVGYGSWGVSTDNNQTPRTKSFTGGVSIRF